MEYEISIVNVYPKEAERIIRLGEHAYYRPLSSIIDITAMAIKWATFAKFLLIKDKGNMAATIVFYENTIECFIYIAHFVVLETYRHMGIGHIALSHLIKIKGNNFKYIRLEVNKSNIHAYSFYIREGFYIQKENKESFLLEKSL